MLCYGYVTYLQELDASTANHFLVLFRDIIGFKFRALYSYTPDTDHVSANTQHSNCMAVDYGVWVIASFPDHKSVWQWTQVYQTAYGLTSLQVSGANTAALCIVKLE